MSTTSVTPKKSLEAISEHLVRRLAQVLTPKSTETLWTLAVKDILGDLGKNELGYYVCCSGSAFKDQGEWLLDLIWMDRGSWTIALAVESEWGEANAIQEDFGKLLCVKAPQKLMLVNTKSHKGSEEIRSTLQAMIDSYPYYSLHEEYLLMECTDVGAYRYVLSVGTDGPGQRARWEEMPGSPLPWNWALGANRP
jgi:hypothetical protein